MNNPKYNVGYESLEVALELRTIDPIFTQLKATGFEHSKVFLYSKVLNTMSLADKCKLGFKPEPWLHCVAVGNDIVAYVWDSREVIYAETNAEACNIIRKAPLSVCVIDHYSTFSEKPILLNSNKVKDADKAMKLAEGWVEPRVQIQYYRKIEDKKSIRKLEFDVNINIPPRHPKIKDLFGQVFVGSYVCTELKVNKFESELDIDLSLFKDIYPDTNSKAKNYLEFKSPKPLSYEDIQLAIINALTI